MTTRGKLGPNDVETARSLALSGRFEHHCVVRHSVARHRYPVNNGAEAAAEQKKQKITLAFLLLSACHLHIKLDGSILSVLHFKMRKAALHACKELASGKWFVRN